MRTPEVEANLASRGITYEQWDEIVEFPLAQMDASLLIGRLMTEIQKTGGSRQRDEGVKLLKRIQARYLEDFNTRSRLAAEARKQTEQPK